MIGSLPPPKGSHHIMGAAAVPREESAISPARRASWSRPVASWNVPSIFQWAQAGRITQHKSIPPLRADTGANRIHLLLEKQHSLGCASPAALGTLMATCVRVRVQDFIQGKHGDARSIIFSTAIPPLNPRPFPMAPAKLAWLPRVPSK